MSQVHLNENYKGRSCLTKLLEVFKHWKRCSHEGYGVDVVYLVDYGKASVSYHI